MKLFRRSKINKACIDRWPGNSFPNFRLPEGKTAQDELAQSLYQECSMPEVNFGLDGIKEHIKAVFNERRRSRKRLGTDYDLVRLIMCMNISVLYRPLECSYKTKNFNKIVQKQKKRKPKQQQII